MIAKRLTALVIPVVDVTIKAVFQKTPAKVEMAQLLDMMNPVDFSGHRRQAVILRHGPVVMIYDLLKHIDPGEQEKHVEFFVTTIFAVHGPIRINLVRVAITEAREIHHVSRFLVDEVQQISR